MALINNIQNALNTKLSSVPGLPTIFYPNIDNTPAQGQPFVRPTLLPALSELYTLNNENRHRGIYQVDIYGPIKKGSAPLWLLADSVREHFNRQSLAQGGDIIHIQEISMSPAQRIESWWSCYVQINYICFN